MSFDPLPAHDIRLLAGGTASQVNAYVGPARELIVDEDSKTLNLQDGLTPGGEIFYPVSLNDTRYQLHSSFLDQIEELEHVEGFLFIGPVGVSSRRIDFDPTQFNTGFGDTISDPYEIQLKLDQPGDWSFDTVTADSFFGSLVGPSAGTHTGPLIGDSTGSHTGPSAGTHTGPQIGDVDARGHTLLLDAEQIPNAALSAAIQALLLLNDVPQWSILMWDSSRAIPAGWQECDGTNGTMDLRGRFPVGKNIADPIFDAGITGGNKTHNHGSPLTTGDGGNHQHVLENALTVLTGDQMPSHRHGSGIGDQSTNSFFLWGTRPASAPGNPNEGSSNSVIEAWTDFTGGGLGHTHEGLSDIHTGHTHPLAVPAASNLPPYAVITYICRVAA